MDHLETVLARLTAMRACGYHAGSPAAAEPTALAALALLAHRRDAAARPHVDRLIAMQAEAGNVGIDPSQTEPGWPTPLAVLAWRAAQQSSLFEVELVGALDRALAWMLATKGTMPEHVKRLGHDTTIHGWPWVAGTHSWVEPTAMNLLALKHTAYARHRRAREAVLLLVNRLLDSGGCNYGNTVVFGQELRPHIEPTGACLLALAAEDDATGRIGRAVEYLQRELPTTAATASLSYGLLGLAAQGAFPQTASDWLQAAAHRTLARDPSGYKLALLALASLGEACPLISRVRSLEPASTVR